MSRGKLTTSTCVWSCEMCSSIVTSFRTADSSSGSPNAPSSGRLSLPTSTKLRPPSIAPMSGTFSSTASLSSFTGGFTATVATRSTAA